VVEVVDDLGAGPVLRVYEFAADDAVAVDYVGLRDLGGAVQRVDAGGGVADGEEIDVVLGEEALIDVGIFVHADGDDGDLGEAALHGEQAGEFLNAGDAPGGPEVEDDDVAAVAAEVGGAEAVGDDELGRGFAQGFGMRAAVAAGGEQRGEEQS
jgi:hypothetical protein